MGHHDLTSLLLRFALGLFFFSAGFHKLFYPSVREKFIGLLTSLHQNNPVNRWIVPIAEMMGGLALLIGFLTPLAAAGLIVILIGAIVLDTWKEVVAKKPKDILDWCAKLIYMPEGLMIATLSALVVAGSGSYSTDAFLASMVGDFF